MPGGESWISVTSTPRPRRSSYASSMSVTTTCMWSSDPGVIRVSPLPMAIEHAEPGGVSWTKRMSSLTVTSWSALKPSFS